MAANHSMSQRAKKEWVSSRAAIVGAVLLAVVARAYPQASGAPTGTPAAPPSTLAAVDPSSCNPVYPPESVQGNETGRVSVRYVVSAAGKLIGLALVSSSGHKRLDQATLDMLGKCGRFIPATQAGKPVESSAVIEYTWKLADEPGAGSEQGPIAGACKPPDYPIESVRAEEQGTTTVKFMLDEHGAVVGAELVRSSGHSRLDDAVVSALRLCRFRPKRSVDGRPITGEAIVEYRWKLAD